MKSASYSSHQLQKAPTLQALGDNTFLISGSWTLAGVTDLQKILTSEKPALLPVSNGSTVVIDGSELSGLDTVGAFYLLKIFGKQAPQFQLQGFEEQELSIFELANDRLKEFGKIARPRNPGVFEIVGMATVDLWKTLHLLLGFIGFTLVEIARSLTRPALFRGKEFFVHLEQAALRPIPIVCMVMFLIGVVLAYLFSGQFERYGANIFIVDATSITICRELSPVIVAIIMAGRSGSAYTAHIGSMRISEEIEALQTMGLSPMRVLVVPRVLALIVALPLLVFIGDIFGMLGGMLIADTTLGITGATYLDRLQRVLPPRHFFVGLGKAPVFALFIAIIGCRMGLTVQKSARSLGLSTTSTVVQSIVSVILLDAFFAVFFMQMGI